MNKTTQELIDILVKMNEKNGNFKKEDVSTFTLCLLLISYLENGIQDTLFELLLDSQKDEAKFPDLIDLLLKEKTFTQKIDILEFLTNRLNLEQDRDMITFYRKINSGMRNPLFHFKLDEIKYDKANVSSQEVQNRIFNDLLSAESKVHKAENSASKPTGQ